MDYSTLQISPPQNSAPMQSHQSRSQAQRRPTSSPSTQREPPVPQRRISGNTPMGSIEKSVTTLLVSTKSLLGSLTAWAQGRMTEQQVSDVYVKLTGDFHKACQSFSKQGINVSDLVDIPDKLRACLEKALSEEASPASLELHLPKIRDVIYTLIQGLKAKQAIYRQMYNNEETSQLQRNLSTGATGPNRSFSQPGSQRTSDEFSSNELGATLRRNISAPSSHPTVRTNPSPSIADPLTALKESHALERRASKRYSAYTHKTSREDFRRLNQQRQLLPPPEHDNINLDEGSNASELPDKSLEVATYETNHVEEKGVPDVNIQDTSKKNGLTLFLKLGKNVKKVVYDGDISISALRMLFIEKFSYNPGMDDFPNICIKDPVAGILYELEDLSDVRNNSVLALNVEALEQVKKHIDENIAALTNEIREIKKSFSENVELLRRNGIANANVSARPAPTESQFRELAKKVLANVKQNDEKESPEKPETKSNSGITEKIVSDIRNQFGEVQNLRRDLGIMRQLYTDFQKDTQQLMESLTKKTNAVKQVAMNDVGSARAFIDLGKTKLDTRSKQLVTRVDELQDIIDELKNDVTQRRSKPRQSSIQHVEKESAAVEEEFASLLAYVKTVKPQWKKAWEKELQTIVEEQKFLTHQEELLEDLQDDHRKLTEVFNNILKVVEIQSKTRPKEFRVAPQEEGFEGIKTVMQEVRGITPDSDRRLRALDQAEKLRERELSNKIDEFEQELAKFVTESKLKKTGGAQEAERLRKKKDEEALKQLFKAES